MSFHVAAAVVVFPRSVFLCSLKDLEVNVPAVETRKSTDWLCSKHLSLYVCVCVCVCVKYLCLCVYTCMGLCVYVSLSPCGM